MFLARSRGVPQKPRCLGGWLMTVRRALWLGLAALIILVSARDAGAGPPTDQLKGAIDRVVATPDSPGPKGDGEGPDRRAALRKDPNQNFDFNEVAPRA